MHIVINEHYLFQLLDTRQPNLVHEAPSVRNFQDNGELFSANQSVYNDELFSTQSFSKQDDDITQNVSLCTPTQVTILSTIKCLRSYL